MDQETETGYYVTIYAGEEQDVKEILARFNLTIGNVEGMILIRVVEIFNDKYILIEKKLLRFNIIKVNRLT